MEARISEDFWSDPVIEELDAECKLAALWCITGPRTNLLGFVEISKKRFEFETSLKFEALERLCEAHSKGFKKCDSGIWVRNYIKYQFGSGNKLIRNNFCKPIVSQLRAMEGLAVFAEVLAEHPELESVLSSQKQRETEALTKGLPSPRVEKSRVEKSRGIDTATISEISQHTEFDQFWAAYPNQRGMIPAQRAWIETAAMRPPIAEMLELLARHKASEAWRADDGKWIPLAAKWLTDGRWLDQLEPVGIPSNPRKKKKEAPADWQATYADVMGYDCPEYMHWERLPDHVQNQILDATKPTQTTTPTE